MAERIESNCSFGINSEEDKAAGANVTTIIQFSAEVSYSLA